MLSGRATRVWAETMAAGVEEGRRGINARFDIRMRNGAWRSVRDMRGEVEAQDFVLCISEDIILKERREDNGGWLRWRMLESG